MSSGQRANQRCTTSAAERAFALLELFEPIVQELSTQDLIAASHVSCTFLNNISSSAPLRQRLLSWRSMSLNDLVLQDTDAIPTGTVGSRTFEYPYLRTRQPLWLFHTEYDDAVLITYRYHVTDKTEEYFLYIPLSGKRPMYAVCLSRLTLDHATQQFTATWKDKISGQVVLRESFDGKLLTYLIRMPRASHEDPTHMFSYLQTWYASANTDWRHWAENHLKLKPPDEPSDQETWLQWKLRAKKYVTKMQWRSDVEVLPLLSFAPAPTLGDPTFQNRHGHIRDGSQTDPDFNCQDTYIARYGNPNWLRTQSSRKPSNLPERPMSIPRQSEAV